MDITTKVVDIIHEEIHCALEAITPEADIVKDLGADSLDIEMIRCALEEEFEINITDELMAKIKTVGDAVDAVESCLTAVQ